jgi:predicted solute-binding protein
MTKLQIITVGVFYALVTSILFAQAQGPKPYGPPISVESAKKIASVALGEARKNNWYMAVAVVDPSGTLVYYEKMAGELILSMWIMTVSKTCSS